jgi:hypothetical protein
MKEITVRKESKPTRCEICHQADLFDPITNICQRCENLALPQNQTSVPIQPITTPQTTLDFVAVGAAFSGVLAFAPGLFFPPLGLILGSTGILLGRRSLSNIRNAQDRLSGESFAYIGIYCGTVSSILAILIILFISTHF